MEPAVPHSTNRGPELSHLRDSGEIEQDADVALFLFHEAYYLALTVAHPR
jgi:replicative DNA helicase